MTELLLAIVLSASAGWVWGHSTARIKVVPVGRPEPGCACRDQTELDVADGINDWHQKDSA